MNLDIFKYKGKGGRDDTRPTRTNSGDKVAVSKAGDDDVTVSKYFSSGAPLQFNGEQFKRKRKEGSHASKRPRFSLTAPDAVKEDREYASKRRPRTKAKRKRSSSDDSDDSDYCPKRKKKTKRATMKASLKAHVAFELLDHNTVRVTVVDTRGELLATVNQLPAALWLRPLSEDQSGLVGASNYSTVLDRLVELGVDDMHALPPLLLQRLQRRRQTAEISRDELSPDILKQLLPFQVTGVLESIRRGGRVLLADEMGLGKTVQALAIAAHYKQNWPIVIVCPASVRVSWARHAVRWLPSLDVGDVCVVFSKKDAIKGPVTIISYGLVDHFHEELLDLCPGVVIADEAHFIKSEKAKRTVALLELMGKSARVLLLSGTPALSRAYELFSQLHALDPELYPDRHAFGVRYCQAQRTRWGWRYRGADKTHELSLVLSDLFMIRRLKRDVLGDSLPLKRRYQITVGQDSVLADQVLDRDEGLEKAEKAGKLEIALSSLTEKGSLSLLAPQLKTFVMRAFERTGIAKVPSSAAYILRLLEKDDTTKVVVFAHHRRVLNLIAYAMKSASIEYVRIDGSTPGPRRGDLLDDFQHTAHTRVALLSITAAGVGVELTSASTVVFAELYWTPGVLLQAEDRLHRLGQQETVDVHFVVSESAADLIVWDMIQDKLGKLHAVGLSNERRLDTDGVGRSDATVDIQARHAGSQRSAGPVISRYFEEDETEEYEGHRSAVLASLLGGMWTCPECGDEMEIHLRDEHEDYHFTAKLHFDDNGVEPESESEDEDDEDDPDRGRTRVRNPFISTEAAEASSGD